MTKGFSRKLEFLRDKGYIAKIIQLSLFKGMYLLIYSPIRNNQTGQSQWNTGHLKIESESKHHSHNFVFSSG